MRIYEIICEGKRHDPAFIQQVKDLSDQGLPPRDIVSYFNNKWPVETIKSILKLHYRDRPNKQYKKPNLVIDDELTQQVKTLWDQGLSPYVIAQMLKTSNHTITKIIIGEVGEEEYNSRLQQDRLLGGKNVPGKITPKMKQTIIDMFTSGAMYKEMVKELNNLVHLSAIHQFLRIQPNYLELLAANKAAKEAKKIQHDQATTKRMTAKPMSKGIKAIRKTGPVTGGKI